MATDGSVGGILSDSSFPSQSSGLLPSPQPTDRDPIIDVVDTVEAVGLTSGPSTLMSVTNSHPVSNQSQEQYFTPPTLSPSTTNSNLAASLEAFHHTHNLLAITYSEFDNQVGPQLKYSYPPDFMTKDTFEAISDYIIVGKHLCDRLITFKQDHWQMLSYSVAIENTKYERNSLSFAFGFVMALETKHTEDYGKLLKKIVTTFVDLEVGGLTQAN